MIHLACVDCLTSPEVLGHMCISKKCRGCTWQLDVAGTHVLVDGSASLLITIHKAMNNVVEGEACTRS